MRAMMTTERGIFQKFSVALRSTIFIHSSWIVSFCAIVCRLPRMSSKRNLMCLFRVLLVCALWGFCQSSSFDVKILGKNSKVVVLANFSSFFSATTQENVNISLNFELEQSSRVIIIFQHFFASFFFSRSACIEADNDECLRSFKLFNNPFARFMWFIVWRIINHLIITPSKFSP